MNSISPRRFSKGVEVPFVDLDSVCTEAGRIHLLKCDIEGAEQQVIETYPDLFAKTECAVIEFHHPLVDREKCVARLKQYGFQQREVLVDRAEVSTELFTRRP